MKLLQMSLSCKSAEGLHDLKSGACFDRVLIFLEATAAGQPAPDFAVHLLGDLLQAGEMFGLQPLQVQISP